MSAYLFVCLFVYQKDILPLASELYKLRHCLGLKHNFPGESLPPCRGLWGTLHTGDDIDCNYCLLWEC